MNTSATTGTAAWISGARLGGDDRIDLVNPADLGAVSRQEVVTDPRTVRRAVAAASDRQDSWSRTSPRALCDVLTRMADEIARRAPLISSAVTREMGKLRAEAEREVDLAVRVFRYAAQHALRSRGSVFRSSSAPDTVLFTRSLPVGVTAVVTPWNFPVSIPAWKIASALAAGNTVVWKPSEVTPTTSLLLMEALLSSAVPEDALHLVLGTGPTIGTALVADPDVQAITFTGSTMAGRAIQAAAATKKVQLEMGGKNSTTIWNDIDLDVAAARVVDAAFGGAGQRCTATSRVLVHREVLQDFTLALTARAANLVVGPPTADSTTMGPVATQVQLDKTVALIDDALHHGAGALFGGRRASVEGRGGFYVEPTILRDVPSGAAVGVQEVFGPVLEVIAVDSLDAAIEVVNSTAYGLSASVFTTRLDVALRFAERVRAGVVKVNQITSGNEMHVPFGGLKDSGFGPPEQGETIDEFFSVHSTVSIAGLLR